MTPATVSSADLSPTGISTMIFGSITQAGFSGSSTSSTKESVQVPVDTVSLSSQSRHASSGGQDLQSTSEKEKKAETKSVTNDRAPDYGFTAVQFVYDPKGELSIRYMDSASRVIYQTPSELMLRLKEAIAKFDSSVDTVA